MERKEFTQNYLHTLVPEFRIGSTGAWLGDANQIVSALAVGKNPALAHTVGNGGEFSASIPGEGDLSTGENIFDTDGFARIVGDFQSAGGTTIGDDGQFPICIKVEGTFSERGDGVASPDFFFGFPDKTGRIDVGTGLAIPLKNKSRSGTGDIGQVMRLVIFGDAGV